ncbi:MAG: hypothetical protein U1A27_01945 [Phycisphaerae bacterium]
MRAAIVGVGVVGQALHRLIPDAVTYDSQHHPASRREQVNGCDLAFVCVPTPMAPDGSCDTSIVESVVDWLQTELIVIRSTIAPGTTDRLRRQTGKRIVFQPEYLGETVAHPMASVSRREFIVLGGPTVDVSPVADFYKRFYHSELQFYFCDAVTAEVAKYMENCFYAVKVTFCNEFFDIAQAFGVDFNLLREVWLADPRISRDHTFVYPDQRGYDGKCLPKDVSAIIHAARQRDCEPGLLAATARVNELIRARSAFGRAPDEAAKSPAPPAAEPTRRFASQGLPEPLATGFRVD